MEPDMTHALTAFCLRTGLKRRFSATLVCAAMALMLAAPFSPVLAQNTQLLPPTVPGSSAVCASTPSSGNILAMIDPGTPGGASAISCIKYSKLTPTGDLTLGIALGNGNLTNTGNLTTGGNAVITGTVSIQGQVADSNTILTANELANISICQPNEVLTKTGTTTFACVGQTISPWQFYINGQPNMLRGVGKFVAGSPNTSGTFTGHIFCGPAQEGIGASVECGREDGPFVAWCGSDTGCAYCHAGKFHCGNPNTDGRYYDDVDVVNLPVVNVTGYQ